VLRPKNEIVSYRVLTESAMSSASHTELSTKETYHGNLSASEHKLSAALLKGQLEPTVVRRAQFKSRPSIISFDAEKGVIEIAAQGSAISSPASSTLSGPMPRPGASTEKTSLDSRFSIIQSRASSHTSSENKKTSANIEDGSKENSLDPIPSE